MVRYSMMSWLEDQEEQQQSGDGAVCDASAGHDVSKPCACPLGAPIQGKGRGGSDICTLTQVGTRGEC